VGAGQTYDYALAVAVASNGNIGLTWYRWIVDNNTGLSNYNMYFAMLSSTGALLYGPANLTNNTLFDNFDNVNVPHFFSPAIAATADNRFILSWQDFRSDGASIFSNNLGLAVENANGTSLINPTPITNDGSSVNPVLNPLSGNNAILSYASNQVVSYFIVGSDGTVSSSHVVPNGFTYQSTDAVALPNGLTALAWTTTGQDIGYVMLDAANSITVGPIFGTNPGSQYNRDISVTYDSSNHIILTWSDDDSSPATRLFYALADTAGTFITAPTSFRSSSDGVITSANGQGNAVIISTPQTMQINIDVMPGNPINKISSKLRILTVAILSSNDFNAPVDVKRSSLTFGKTGNEASLLFCFQKSVDVNHDGKPDLLCLFDMTKTGLAVGDTQAVLRGSTQSGTPFEGRDTVKVLKR
jgi:hypothetical protein